MVGLKKTLSEKKSQKRKIADNNIGIKKFKEDSANQQK